MIMTISRTGSSATGEVGRQDGGDAELEYRFDDVVRLQRRR